MGDSHGGGGSRQADRWTREGWTHVLVDTGFGEEFEELEFTEGAEAEEGVFEGKNLLDGNLSVGRLVEGGYDSAVGTFAEAVEDLIIVACENRIGYASQFIKWTVDGDGYLEELEVMTYRRGREEGASGPYGTLGERQKLREKESK